MRPSEQEIQYLGLLDDKVYDYPWTNRTVDLQYINEQLAKQALTSPAIALNAGYLMHYDDGRTALAHRQQSPLRDLVESGFVVLLSSSGDKLYEMPRMQADKVPSYKRLIDSNAWPDLENTLREYSTNGSLKRQIESWPPVDIGVGLYSLLMSLQDMTPEQLGITGAISDNQFRVFIHEFKSRFEASPKKGPRSIWEESLQEMFGQNQRCIHEMMKLANEAHHYNFAACLLGNNPNRKVGVVTRYSGIFAGLRNANPSRFSEYPAQLYTCVPSLPDRRFLFIGKALRKVVEPDTDINKAKEEWRTSFFKAVQSPNADNIKVASWASKIYERKLGELFDPDSARTRATAAEVKSKETQLKILFTAASPFAAFILTQLFIKITGIPLPGVLQAGIVALVAAGSAYGTHLFGEWWNEGTASSTLQEPLIKMTNADIKEGKATNSLPLDPTAASQHVRSLPVWK